MRFSLTRLSDNLQLEAFTVLSTTRLITTDHTRLRRGAFPCLAHKPSLRWSSHDFDFRCNWLLTGMHRHLPPRWIRLKQRPFPPDKLCCLVYRWACAPPVLWPPPTSHPASAEISSFDLYPLLRLLWTTDRMRSLLFHRLLSQHPALPTPEGS